MHPPAGSAANNDERHLLRNLFQIAGELAGDQHCNKGIVLIVQEAIVEHIDNSIHRFNLQDLDPAEARGF